MNILNTYRNKGNQLCESNKVKQLYAFGSVLTSAFNEDGDIDLIVDFDKDDDIDVVCDGIFGTALGYNPNNILQGLWRNDEGNLSG